MKAMMMLALAAVLAINGAPALAADDDLTAKIAAAKTAADHEAIADEYAKEAAEAEANAAKHDKMAASYKGGGKLGQFHAEQHCKSIADRDHAQAKDLNALAAAHRAQAQAASK
jgi:hypothetical protein